MPPYGNSAYEDASTAMTTGLTGLSGIASGGALPQGGSPLVAAQGQAGQIAPSMSSFLSPYRSRVIDDAVARLRDRRSEDLNMIKSKANQMNAYGGSRQGIIEADLIDKYGRNEDELVSRLLQQGFDTSATLGAQQAGMDQNASMQNAQMRNQTGQFNIGSMLQNAGLQTNAANSLMAGGGQMFDIGNMAMDRQAAAGMQQQSFLQQLLDMANQQVGEYGSSPMDSVSKMMAGLSGNPLQNNRTQTTTKTPGLFDWLSLGAGTLVGLQGG